MTKNKMILLGHTVRRAMKNAEVCIFSDGGLLRKGEVEPNGDDDWRQCPLCATKYNMNKDETKHEAEIGDLLTLMRVQNSNKNIETAFRYDKKGKKSRLQNYNEQKHPTKIKDLRFKRP